MMSDLKICRICLRTQCKVYKFNVFQLKSYYEEVMAIKVDDKDGLPQYFCYECATILHKFHKFKEKCYTGQNVLKEISWRGPMTYEAVYNIDRALRNLKSPLDILTVTKRVKTYIDVENSEVTESEFESIQAEDEKEFDFGDIETHQDAVTDDEFSDVVEDTKVEVLIDDGTKVVKNADESLDIEELDKKIDDDIPGSPKTVFIDVKKDVVVLKSEPIKLRRRNLGTKTNRRTNRKRHLDTKYWKKYILSEEEAVKEFQLKAKDQKYLSAAFQCVHCYKGFSKEDMLRRHKQLRHSDYQGYLECRFCRMRFKWDCQLRKHLRQHFTRYICLQCNLRCCSENTALLHTDYHKGVIRKCIHCGDEFKHSSTYYTHLRTHRSEYLCALCGMSFVSPMGLHMHKKIKHIINEIESPDDDEEVNTFCEKCDIRFETRKAYEEHLFHSNMHTDGVEDELNEYNDVPRKVLGKKLKAKITHSLKRKRPIEDTFPNTDGRRRKRRCYKKPTTCHQCGEHFSTQAACLRHHLSAHPRTSFFAHSQRHICEVCGASLAPGSVAMHQNMHTKQKVFPCEACDKTFHSSVGLKRHSVTHTGEKPFACSLCDKRFTQSNSMKLHYRTFHLKQPYPKRNRRKKKDGPPEVTEDKSSGDESEASLPGTEPAAADPPGLHYLTLS